MLNSVEKLALIFTLVGAGIFIMAYIYYSSLLIASERIVKRIKEKYIEAILK